MGNPTKKIAGAVKNSADSVAAGAGKAKDFVVEKSRASLDKAYAAKKADAVAKLAALRASNPEAKPADIINLLEQELKSEELHAGTNSDAFTSAVAMFVFTVIEVHGANKKNAVARQRLIDSLVVIDSKTARNVAKYGGIAVALFSKRLRILGTAVAAISTLRSRAPWIKRGLAILGVKNPGKKGVAVAITSAVKKSLGPAPKLWPTTPRKATK